MLDLLVEVFPEPPPARRPQPAGGIGPGGQRRPGAAGRGPLELAAAYAILAVLFAAWSAWQRDHSSP
jgi:hypothetical protein